MSLGYVSFRIAEGLYRRIRRLARQGRLAQLWAASLLALAIPGLALLTCRHLPGQIFQKS